MSYPMIAARVFGTPLLVDPAKGAAFVAGLGPRLINGALELRGLEGLPEARLARAGRIGPRASIIADDVGERARGNGRRLFRLRDGVAVIEVTGTLVHRGDYIGESSGTTSYEGLAAQIAAAAADPTVKGIALEIDTFGGEVAGAFDLADAIRAVRAHKPVRAFVAESALSAGYVLAAQADRIVLPRTGEVGSIGVLTIHADYSQRLADEGVAITLIHAGAHKVDGNPYEALPDDVRGDLQLRVDQARELFAQTVGAGRGRRLSAQAALASEARVYQGAEAVAAGLADEVGDLRSAFAGFVAELDRPRATARPGQTASARSPTSNPPAPSPSVRGGTPAKETQTMSRTDPEDEVETDAPAPAVPEQTRPDAQAEPEAPTAVTPAAAAPKASTPAPATTDAAQTTISRAAAAELAEVAQLAGRLGVAVDLADAIGRGLSADQLRRTVLGALAANAQQADLVVASPAAGRRATESPLVAAARRTAEAQKAQRAAR